MPGFVTFDADEMRRIEEAELILLGIPPSEIKQMSLEQVETVFAIANAKAALQNGKMPS